MTAKLLTEQHFEFLSLRGGCTDSSESTLVKMHATLLEITCHGSNLLKFMKMVKCLIEFEYFYCILEK